MNPWLNISTNILFLSVNSSLSKCFLSGNHHPKNIYIYSYKMMITRKIRKSNKHAYSLTINSLYLSNSSFKLHFIVAVVIFSLAIHPKLHSRRLLPPHPSRHRHRHCRRKVLLSPTKRNDRPQLFHLSL